MKKTLLLLMIVPMIGIGQCVSGNCENGYGYIIKEFGEYEGQFKNARFHGEGTLTLNAGYKYVGGFKYDQFHGNGTYIWSNGDKYIGEFKNGKKTGKGTYIIEKNGREGGEYIGIYEGEFKDGLADGQGIWTWPDGEKYVGSFVTGFRNGQGIYTWSDDNKYEGKFSWNGFPYGEGQLIWNNKTIEGKWTDEQTFLSIDGKIIIHIDQEKPRSGLWRLKVKDGSPLEDECISGDCENGHGTFTWANGGKYVGEWKDGKQHGQGTLTITNGKNYVGGFKDGSLHGQGIYTDDNGNKYEGKFKDGYKHGQGVLTYASGSKYEGEWENGNQNGNGIYVSAETDYEGIGASLSSNIDSNYVVITKVYKGLPSEKAGLFEGDKFLEVNGETAKGKTTQELSSILKGTANTKVNILIERNGNNITFRFNREKIKLPSYKYTGEWKDGKWHGQGVYISIFGEKHQGLFEEGKFISGECWDEDGNEIECP